MTMIEQTTHDNVVVIELDEPITSDVPVDRDGAPKTVSALHIRRPKARDLRVMDGVEGNVSRTLALLARLSNVPLQVVEELSVADFTRAGEVIGRFLPSGPVTGATP